ncbi:MAG: hypothetical protein COB02_00340 [Candidatus Cloacimonadota bacterium]|nr:MAG: hypothetical protein COB02_00340 [Candidatus Cloacimonadota bacterium]
MDFEWKWPYLICGILMTGMGAYAVKSFLSEKESKIMSENPPQLVFLIGLILFILGFIVLRLSWVLFFGLSKSVVF